MNIRSTGAVLKVSQRVSVLNCGSRGQINLTKNNSKQHFWELELKVAFSVNRRARGERKKTRQTNRSSLLKTFFPLHVFSSHS